MPAATDADLGGCVVSDIYSTRGILARFRAPPRKELQLNQGFTVWLTGLSGAGKSTIAERLAPELSARGRKVEVLDGDEVRTHLSKGLGFSREDRDINIGRISFVASLLVKHGAAVITAAISPYAQARADARQRIGSTQFVEIFVRCSLDELTRRDVKGLYAKAIAGELKHFTGVSDPYEVPENPDVVVDSEFESVEESVSKILAELERRGHLPAGVKAAV
jgi:adenylyl-sulfate kinase